MSTGEDTGAVTAAILTGAEEAASSPQRLSGVNEGTETPVVIQYEDEEAGRQVEVLDVESGELCVRAVLRLARPQPQGDGQYRGILQPEAPLPGLGHYTIRFESGGDWIVRLSQPKPAPSWYQATSESPPPEATGRPGDNRKPSLR